MKTLAIGIISLLYLTGSSAAVAVSSSGSNDHWVVSQLSGDARLVHPGLRPAALKVNAQIVSGDTLVTGANGRATLVRGADYIIVAPHSELRLPTAAQPTGFTRVVESMGTMLFKIQHTGIPHFAVDTPMLAAVVKGTTFTVVVDQNRSAVQVIQGAVQVTAIDGGMTRLVEGGRTAFINRAEPKVLLDADQPSVSSPAPSSTSLQISAAGDNPLATIAQLTSGLVRPDTTSLQPKPPVEATTLTVAAGNSVQSTALTTGTSGVAAPANASPTVSVSVASTAGNSTPGVTVAPVTTGAGSVSTAIVSTVTTPSASGAVTSPTVTLPSVSTPAVTTPGVTVALTSTPAVTVPAVTTPVVTTPAVTIPAVTTPVVTTPAVTVPAVTIPAITTPAVTVPAVTTPVITTPAITVPAVTTPVITTPAVSVPAVSVPAVTVPAVTMPVIATPAVTVPAVTTPVITTPAVSVPAVTVPAVSVPAVTVPAVSVPAVTVPAVTTPVIATPAVTVPAVTTPVISTPVVTVPAVVVTPPPILGH